MSDFTMFVASEPELGIYHYFARSDILVSYPEAQWVRPPVKTGVVEIEACPPDETSATTLVFAMEVLCGTAGSVCGFNHKYQDKIPKWTLELWVDSEVLAGVLLGEEENDRVEAIVGRCDHLMGWFDTQVGWKEMGFKEVIFGKELM